MRKTLFVIVAVTFFMFGLITDPAANATTGPAVRATSAGYNPCFGDGCDYPGTYTVNKPAGTLASDLLVAIQFPTNGITAPIPSGFTEIAHNTNTMTSPTNPWIRVYTAPGSTTAPYTFSDNGGSSSAVVIAVTGGAAINIAPSFNAGGPSTTSDICNSVTPTVPNALLLCGATGTTATSYTAPSGMTKLADVYPPELQGAAVVAAQNLTSASGVATGTRTLTATSSGTYSTVALAITSWKQLTPGTHWQWQLSGTVNETALDSYTGPKMYDIDMFDATSALISRLHGKGISVICYVESGDWNNVRPDAGDYPPSILGNTISGFPNEKFVNINALDSPTGPTGKTLRQIMMARLDLAQSKGCDGVEPDLDDLHNYTTGFTITQANQVAYNTVMITAAHSRGMSMGLKNGASASTGSDSFEQQMVNAGADWALNEECNQHTECVGYTQFITAGRAVFQVEYLDNQTVPYSGANGTCALDNIANFDGIVKDSSSTLSASPLIECR